jgi:transposase
MIFANVRDINASADADPESLRISVDTKATVNVGDYSRGGKSRGLTAVSALDHDMHPKEKLIPGGILETVSGKSFLFFGNSCKTSDFLADGLLLWWKERKQELAHIKHIVINMDNGPECNGHRSQFLYPMAEFADTTGLKVQLVYYPPYHSKYNGIERFWACLEKSWNGYLLDSVITVLNRAASFAWKKTQPIVKLLDTVYEKGVNPSKKEKRMLENRISRSTELPWWNITIHPKMGSL